MELNMFAYTASGKDIPAVDYMGPGEPGFFEWRNHPRLHLWMKELYLKRGGLNPFFNRSTVRLTEDDLRRLQVALIVTDLPTNEDGFFLSGGDDVTADLAFINEARKALNDGLSVLYIAEW